jgi:hypothetical protein
MLISSCASSKANPSTGTIAWAWTIRFNHFIKMRWFFSHHIQLQGGLHFYSPQSSQQPTRIWNENPTFLKKKKKEKNWSKDFMFHIALKRRGNITLDNMSFRYTLTWNLSIISFLILLRDMKRHNGGLLKSLGWGHSKNMEPTWSSKFRPSKTQTKSLMSQNFSHQKITSCEFAKCSNKWCKPANFHYCTNPKGI